MTVCVCDRERESSAASMLSLYFSETIHILEMKIYTEDKPVSRNNILMSRPCFAAKQKNNSGERSITLPPSETLQTDAEVVGER